MTQRALAFAPTGRFEGREFVGRVTYGMGADAEREEL